MNALSARIPDDLIFNLEKACEVMERSKGYIVRKALESYLENLQDYITAEHAYDDYVKNGKKSVDLNDVAKNLGVEIKNYK